MKKILVIYIGILLGVFILFSLLDWQSDYVIERKLWPIQKQYIAIAKDPTVVPEQTYTSVINQYRQIIARYPKSRLIQGVHFIISEIYIIKKDYNAAREELKLIVKSYPEEKTLVSNSYGRIGKTYEIEKNWPEALKYYKNVINNFPKTNMGMGLPIYIAQYYRNKNDYQNTVASYEEAMAHYKKIATENSDNFIGMAAQRFMANCYIDQNRWKDAVDTLSNVLIQYSDSRYLTRGVARSLVVTIYALGVLKMKDYDVTINAYKDFINKRPKHPLVGQLQMIIKGLETLKSKNVVVPAS